MNIIKKILLGAFIASIAVVVTFMTYIYVRHITENSTTNASSTILLYVYSAVIVYSSIIGSIYFYQEHGKNTIPMIIGIFVIFFPCITNFDRISEFSDAAKILVFPSEPTFYVIFILFAFFVYLGSKVEFKSSLKKLTILTLLYEKLNKGEIK